MEISRLKHNVLCCLVCSRAFSAEHSGYTHWLFGVTYCEVMFAKGMLHPIECDELLSLVLVFHYDMASCHHICIEAVEGLSVSHHDIVRYVYDVVYWA